MRKCFLDKCNFTNNGEYSIYKFPNRHIDTDLFLKWTDFCQIERAHAFSIINSAHLCEQHFSKICFHFDKNGTKKLKKGSIPSISNVNRIIIDRPINKPIDNFE